MGGEWDSTNVVQSQVQVFTPIAIDHAKQLGSTVAEIARTKSGIIKPSSAVVSSAQVPEALAELERAAELTESTLAVEGTGLQRRRRHPGRRRAAHHRAGHRRPLRRPVPAAVRRGTRPTTPPWRSPRSSRSSAAGAQALDEDVLSRGPRRRDQPRSPAADRDRPDRRGRRRAQPARCEGPGRGAAGRVPVRARRRRRRDPRRQGRPRVRPRAQGHRRDVRRDAAAGGTCARRGRVRPGRRRRGRRGPRRRRAVAAQPHCRKRATWRTRRTPRTPSCSSRAPS